MSCGGGCGGGCGPWTECGPGGDAEPCAEEPDPCPGPCTEGWGGSSACADLAELLRDGAPEPTACADRTNGAGCVVAGPCGPWANANSRIPDCVQRKGLGLELQGLVDDLRRIPGEEGLRPYRVYLVWTRRGVDQVFREFRRLELQPVKVSSMDAVALQLAAWGLNPEGQIRLTKISRAQVDEDDLRGLLGHAAIPPDVQFFYEVVRVGACEADGRPSRRRFVLASVPHLDAPRFQYTVVLSDQEHARGPNGEDRQIHPGPPEGPWRGLRR